MSETRMRQLLILCILLFIASVIGSVYCGVLLGEGGLTADRELYLRRLIYFHFVLSQLSVLGGLVLLYFTRYRARRSNLLVSYNENGLHLLPPGIKLRPHTSYHCCLGKIAESELPPPTSPIIVYPMMMQSGYSSGERLEKELRAAYAAKGMQPQLFIQPVIGASPWLVKAAVELVQKHYQQGMAILVVAHESASGMEETPEPKLFCRRLREQLPNINISLCYFGNKQSVLSAMGGMVEQQILLLSFLLTEGVHYHRDLPSMEDAALQGKELHRLPVLGHLLEEEN